MWELLALAVVPFFVFSPVQSVPYFCANNSADMYIPLSYNTFINHESNAHDLPESLEITVSDGAAGVSFTLYANGTQIYSEDIQADQSDVSRLLNFRQLVINYLV